MVGPDQGYVARGAVTYSGGGPILFNHFTFLCSVDSRLLTSGSDLNGLSIAPGTSSELALVLF